MAHAAAPCPVDVKRATIEWWGPVIVEYYGATETGAVTFHTAEEALRKPGTVGRPRPGGVVRICDKDGKALPPGEIGEVYLGMGGWPDFTYHNLPQQRRECGRDGLVLALGFASAAVMGDFIAVDRRWPAPATRRRRPRPSARPSGPSGTIRSEGNSAKSYLFRPSTPSCLVKQGVDVRDGARA